MILDSRVPAAWRALHAASTLRIPSEAREVAERALARHQGKCPTAVSPAPAVRISWTADIEETT